MLIAMLAVLQHAVILLMPCVSALITPLGLAQMQMRVCVRAGMGVCVLGKTPPLVTVHVCHLLYSEYGEAAVLATSVQK